MVRAIVPSRDFSSGLSCRLSLTGNLSRILTTLAIFTAVVICEISPNAFNVSVWTGNTNYADNNDAIFVISSREMSAFARKRNECSR